jgi:hypothetical protein
VPKQIYYINYKVQLVTFKIVPFPVCTLVPNFVPPSEATPEIFFGERSHMFFGCIFELWNRVIVNIIFGNSHKSLDAKSGECVMMTGGNYFISQKLTDGERCVALNIVMTRHKFVLPLF